jgi:prolycopene isomerase
MTIITSERILKSEYDVIVIGAGLGGLTASSLLAKRGVDVLLVEQHYLPGGACTSFVRDDRIFDAGAALIFGFGQTGYNIHHNLMNYVEEPITVIPRDKFWRLDFAGQPLLFWKDLNKFLKELEKLFPDEKEEIHGLYGFLKDFYAKYIEGKDLLTPPSEMSIGAKLKLFFSSPLRVMKLSRLLSMSAYDLMSPYLKSQNLVQFFDKLCGSYAYTNMKETPALMALTMFTDNHAGGTYYVAGSAQTYTNTLEKAIERYGGTVLYESLVDQIIFEDARASGVRLVDGTIVGAKKVLSNATVWNLYHNLIPQEMVTEEQKAWADGLIPTYPAMVLYAAVDKNVFPDDINAVEYYVRDLKQIEMGDITLYIPSVDDHSLGPPDEHIITMFSPAPNQNWPRPFEKSYQTPEYEREKKKRAELILDEVEKRIPGLKSGIRKLYIATPSTIERYTLKNWGSVGGPKQMVGQDLTRRLPAKTPWRGVYACGDSTTMGMGMPAATASGFGAANVILRALKKKEFHRKEFDHEFVTYIESNPIPEIPKKIDYKPDNASLIARECQHCEDQVCRNICPAGIDIGGFVRRIEARNYVGAARLVREKNPLAEICGYVCSGVCEEVCNRLKFDSKSVQIRELHRWVAEYAGEEGFHNTPGNPNGRSVCVIGAGPAGMSCAHFLARLGYSVNLMDKDNNYGGYLLELVKQDMLPQEVLDRELSGLMIKGIVFHGNWTYTDEKLDEIKMKHDAIFLTVESEQAFPSGGIVITGGKVYSDDKKSFAVVDAVAEGRRAAIDIHRKLE